MAALFVLLPHSLVLVEGWVDDEAFAVFESVLEVALVSCAVFEHY